MLNINAAMAEQPSNNLLHHASTLIEPAEGGGWFVAIADGGLAQHAIIAIATALRRGGCADSLVLEALANARNVVQKEGRRMQQHLPPSSPFEWVNPVSAIVAHLTNDMASFSWVGGVQALLVSGGLLRPVTDPHVDYLTTRDVAGILTVRPLQQRSLDGEAPFDVSSLTPRYEDGDRLLVCSESVAIFLRNSWAVTNRNSDSPSMSAARLVEETLDSKILPRVAAVISISRAATV